MEPLHRLAFLFFRTVDQKMSALNMLTIRGIPRTAGRMPKMPRKKFSHAFTNLAHKPFTFR